MTKLRSKGLTGAVLVAVLMAGSLRGLEARADNAVVWEAPSAAAESRVVEGQGWLAVAACIACLAGALVATVITVGTATAVTAVGCGVACAILLA